MKVDFVTHQIALKLKEKGFPQVKDNTLAMYNENGEWFSLATNLDKYEYSFEDFDDRDCVCPTIAQVLKWLREEKSIYVAPCVIEDCDTDADSRIINRFTFWSFDIQIVETADIIYSEYENIGSKRFDFYEEAALVGIEYVLDKLI